MRSRLSLLPAWVLPLVVLSLTCVGAVTLGPIAWDSLTGPILALRIWRLCAALVVGAALALSGVGMQCLLRNPLADPFILGMSGGASLGAVGSILAGLSTPAPFAAIGALGAAMLVQVVSKGPSGQSGSTRLILSGVAVASVLGALTSFMIQIMPDDGGLRAALFWTAGHMGAAQPHWIVAAGLLTLASAGWLMLRAPWMDRLLMGEDIAYTLGVPVKRLRIGLLVVCALLTAAAVCLGGLIGFIGLLAPHLARMLSGPAHRMLIGTSALWGALMLAVADLTARTAFVPRELPAGILTAALGGPFFLWLLQRHAYGFGEAA